MNVFDKGLLTILICVTVFFVLSIPLILRKVPRNRVYGYRTRTTLSNDIFWYKANAYFGLRLLLASVLSACIAVALHLWQGISAAIYLKISVVLLVAPAITAALLTARFIRADGTGCQSSNGHR